MFGGWKVLAFICAPRGGSLAAWLCRIGLPLGEGGVNPPFFIQISIFSFKLSRSDLLKFFPTNRLNCSIKGIEHRGFLKCFVPHGICWLAFVGGFSGLIFFFFFGPAGELNINTPLSGTGSMGTGRSTGSWRLYVRWLLDTAREKAQKSTFFWKP